METAGNIPLGEGARQMTAPKFGLNKHVVLYMSSVWAMAEQRKVYETMTMWMDVKRVKYVEIDLSLAENEAAKKELHAKAQTKMLPQLWIDDKYCGRLEELRDINENDRWEEVFGT